MEETRRIIFPSQGPQVEPIQKAFRYLIKICEESEKKLRVVLFIPGKGNLDGTTLEEALPPDVVKRLKKGDEIPLPNNSSLKVETVRTFRGSYSTNAIIAIYAYKEMLDKIDTMKRLDHVIIVPWLIDELSDWISTWNPIIDGEPTQLKKEVIQNPVVEEVLKSLTMSVNLHTGLTHPSDKASAVQIFRELMKYHELYNPDSIRIWAMQNGWTPDGADQLKDISQGVLDGKRYRIDKRHHWRKDIIEYIRQKVSEEEK